MEPSASHSPPPSPPITTTTTTTISSSSTSSSSASAVATETVAGTEISRVATELSAIVTELSEPPLPSPSLRSTPIALLWPEECIECVAKRLALDTASQLGPLPVAPALANLFQVCTGWRSVSQSEILWEALCRHVWDRSVTSLTWRSEYIRWHRITSNFRCARYRHSILEYDPSTDTAGNNSNNGTSACRCLALSEKYVACGFSDGAVRIFDIASKRCIRSLKPVPETRLGPHSRAVAGIILNDEILVFASLDGTIFSSDLTETGLRRVLAGNTIDNGIMVDFTGSSQWWVGLYAGIPGHAIRIWNAHTEQLIYTGGDFTDPDAVRGWHLLTNPLDRVGRLRITPDGQLITVTRSRFSIIDLETQDIAVNLVDPLSPHVIFQAVDISKNCLLLVTADGNYLPIARIMEIPAMVEKVRFDGVISIEPNEEALKKILGGLNTCYAVLSIAGTLSVYNKVSGSRIYGLQEVVYDAVDLVTNNQCIACCGVDEHSIHLYDFSGL